MNCVLRNQPQPYRSEPMASHQLRSKSPTAPHRRYRQRPWPGAFSSSAIICGKCANVGRTPAGRKFTCYATPCDEGSGLPSTLLHYSSISRSDSRIRQPSSAPHSTAQPSPDSVAPLYSNSNTTQYTFSEMISTIATGAIMDPIQNPFSPAAGSPPPRTRRS